MRNVGPRLWYVAATALLSLCFVPATSRAQNTMTLTSGGNFVLDGVYVGPYSATINGVSTQIVCDDYDDETYLNETWQAYTSSFPDPTNTYMENNHGATQQGYNEVAWLTQQLFAQVNAPGATNSSVGDVQFALWAIFGGESILNNLSGSDYTNALNWYNEAQGYENTSASGFTVYSWNGSTPTCGNGYCPPPPQEFLVATPEASQAGTLAADLLLFAVAVLVLRRRGLLAIPH